MSFNFALSQGHIAIPAVCFISHTCYFTIFNGLKTIACFKWWSRTPKRKPGNYTYIVQTLMGSTNCTSTQASIRLLLSVFTLKAQLQRHQHTNGSSRPGEALGIEPTADLKWLRIISDGQNSCGVFHPKVASRRLDFVVHNPLQELIVHLLLLSSV